MSDEGIRNCLHDVPYPFNAKARLQKPNKATHNPLSALLQTYAAANWNRAKIDARIAQVATWAQARQVHLICKHIQKFGAYGISSPPTARLQWLSDVRQVLEQYQDRGAKLCGNIANHLVFWHPPHHLLQRKWILPYCKF